MNANPLVSSTFTFTPGSPVKIKAVIDVFHGTNLGNNTYYLTGNKIK
ncbi:MAG: hypothetical protein ACHQIM_21320 [Sphingobacteriales bacterium]